MVTETSSDTAGTEAWLVLLRAGFSSPTCTFVALLGR